MKPLRQALSLSKISNDILDISMKQSFTEAFFKCHHFMLSMYDKYVYHLLLCRYCDLKFSVNFIFQLSSASKYAFLSHPMPLFPE